MFRLQNNVPEVYVQESRDFQLFCRLYDSIFGGVKYNVDSLLKSTDTSKCSIQLFDLLKLKLGLFTDLPLTNDQLRLLLIAYPTLIRNKGTKRGLNYCSYLIQRLTRTLNSSVGINIINSTYTIQIIINEDEVLNQLFIQLIKTVIPPGYNLEILIRETFIDNTNLTLSDKIEVYNQSNTLVLEDNISPDEIKDSKLDADTLTSVVGVSIVGQSQEISSEEEASK